MSLEYPSDRRYSGHHTWALDEQSAVRVGITDFAQDALGEVIWAELADPGTSATSGEPLGELESAKATSDVVAPISGTIVEVNGELLQSPTLINQDPYGAGWLYTLEADESQIQGLLDAGAYAALVDEDSG